MLFVIVFQFAIIILLISLLMSKKKQARIVTSLIRHYGKNAEKITYSWTLDSAKKTKLKGHLTLKFDPDEIQEQRMHNPFSVINHQTPETNLREMYIYMLNNPRTLLHSADIVRYINRECSRYNIGELDKLQFVLDFVQEPNVKYNYDHDCAEIHFPKEYIRFPDETLYDRHGDCDCKSFLAATLFHLMGYNVLFLISYKLGHAAICVEYSDRWKAFLQDGKNDVITEIDGRKYVYCETTSDHFRIGGISSEYTVNDFEYMIELRS